MIAVWNPIPAIGMVTENTVHNSESLPSFTPPKSAKSTKMNIANPVMHQHNLIAFFKILLTSIVHSFHLMIDCLIHFGI